jgi:hypothetical protein
LLLSAHVPGCPPDSARASGLFGTSALSHPRLCLADDLVAEVGEALADGPGVEEADGLLLAGSPKRRSPVPSTNGKTIVSYIRRP